MKREAFHCRNLGQWDTKMHLADGVKAFKKRREK